MGVYIPNMNLPQEKFARFIISIDSAGMAYVGGKAVGKVAEIKAPHGDLIDRDELLKEIIAFVMEKEIGYPDIVHIARCAETTIPAEEE